MDDAEGYEINRQTQLHTKQTLLDTDVFIEILSRTSLKTFHIIRRTSKHLEKLTYNSHVLDLFKGKNNVLHGVIVQQKKVWGSIERKFVSSCGSINFDIGCIPNSCTILATSLNGLILGECDCSDEYPEKFLFICKPTTLDCRTLPFSIYKYIAVKFAMVVMRSNPFHFKIIRLSYAESDDVTNDRDYENFRQELFQSTTWEWRDLGNIRLPYSVHPVSDETIISKGVVYILLSNYQILQFDAYSEEYAYQQTKVHFISQVNIDLINMEMLGRFSKSLGYTTLGNWYHMPTEENSGLSMIPILNDECLGPFKTIVRAHKFREIEHLYVEHRTVFVPINFPHFLMNSPSKRVEKLIHMFVTEHPMATVDDGIAYIKHMLNMTIPREKMEDAMDMAKENVIAWKNIVYIVMDSLGNTSVHSSDIDFPLTTDVSTALPSDTIEDEQVTRRRRGGRPRVRGRPPDCSIDDITSPRCRRGRPSFVVSPYFVGDNAHRYSQHGSIHVNENIITSNSVPSMAFSSACTVNIDVTRASNRPSPHMIISSSTTIGIDGNPVHSTIMSNLNAPSTTNNSVVHSVVRTYSLHNGRSSTVLPSNTFEAPAVRRPSRGGRPRVVCCRIGIVAMQLAHVYTVKLYYELLSMLDENNSLVQAFRMAKDRFHESSTQSVKIRLIGNRTKDGRQYNLPTVSEVAALIPGDGSPIQSRDVLIEDRGDGTVRRISELHPSFMALQYPLLFPYGEDGFHLNIPLSSKTLHKAGRLFHTFIVDAYVAVLEHDLDWYKRNQSTIHSELYHGLTDSLCRCETSASYVGRRVILPSSFNGGLRHKIQQYQNAMAICRWAGTPDLFVTMTCNPK
ncbi:unnamed protein product [Lactuca virosa]|uniref:Helitron helicase-like domain-containing protein n=1 Tax=Lactuca virosa TaxID=75947 RepID=A0AAU9PBE6_9ASTR|nr:unnamed protein product [Lactuca virosa]